MRQRAEKRDQHIARADRDDGFDVSHAPRLPSTLRPKFAWGEFERGGDSPLNEFDPLGAKRRYQKRLAVGKSFLHQPNKTPTSQQSAIAKSAGRLRPRPSEGEGAVRQRVLQS